MEYWGIWVRGVYVAGVHEVKDQCPALSIDDTLNGYEVLRKAKTLSDLFGEGWDKVPA